MEKIMNLLARHTDVRQKITDYFQINIINSPRYYCADAQISCRRIDFIKIKLLLREFSAAFRRSFGRLNVA